MADPGKQPLRRTVLPAPPVVPGQYPLDRPPDFTTQNEPLTWEDLGEPEPPWYRRVGSDLYDWLGSLFQPSEEARISAELLKYQLEKQTPRATIGGHDVPLSVMEPIQKLAIDQGLDATTPAGAAMNFAEPAKIGGAALAAMPFLRRLRPAGRLGAGELGSMAETLYHPHAVGGYKLRPETLERLARIHDLGESLRPSNWVGVYDPEFLQAFGGNRDAAHVFAQMFGATSPRTSVPVNTRESVTAFHHALTHPENPYFTDPLARRLGFGSVVAKTDNLNRALLGETLSGPKVAAMGDFMEGLPRIPIDRHALYALGLASQDLDPQLTALKALMNRIEGYAPRAGSPGLSQVEAYARYERALADALREIAPGQSLNQVFATLWEGARAHQELPFQGGVFDILKKKGLLRAGAMLDPDYLGWVLRQKGTWTALGVGGLLAAIGEGQRQDELAAAPPPQFPFPSPGGVR